MITPNSAAIPAAVSATRCTANDNSGPRSTCRGAAAPSRSIAANSVTRTRTIGRPVDDVTLGTGELATGVLAAATRAGGFLTAADGRILCFAGFGFAAFTV